MQSIVIDTPEGIEFFRLCSLRGRCQLQAKGIKFKGGSDLRVAREDYGTTSYRYAETARQLTELIEKIEKSPASIWETPRGRRLRSERVDSTTPARTAG